MGTWSLGGGHMVIRGRGWAHDHQGGVGTWSLGRGGGHMVIRGRGGHMVIRGWAHGH